MQHESSQSSSDEGLGWQQMSVEANESNFQRKSLMKAVYSLKDKTFLHKQEWSKIAFNFCQSPKCSLKHCYCGSRKPENVPSKVLAEYLEKFENPNYLEV